MNRLAPIFVFCACLALVTVAPLFAPPAQAKARVVPFAKAGNWTVQAVYSENGPFNHCSASARYTSGTRVSIIVYANSNWRLWFAHDSWPSRAKSTFPATVTVDGRVVLSQAGYFSGRNAYVDLGREVSRVRALMRGRSMAISTPAGTSRFSLTGTNQATQQVARCWTAHYRAPAAGGAFGSANNNGAASGAFGGGTAQRPRANELSRGGTLEIATSYLSKAQQPYSILQSDQNVLKHFPVNWKMQDGQIGGMRVFQNSAADVETLLGTLLSDQAKLCKGRNASERESSKVINGRRMARARGVCAGNDGIVLNVTYKVAELGRQMVMMVMEVRTGASDGASGGAGAVKSAPEAGKDGAIHVPGPNEL